MSDTKAINPKPLEKTHTTVYDDITNTHWEVGENDTVESIKELIIATRTRMEQIESDKNILT